jgi:hypothetical protein
MSGGERLFSVVFGLLLLGIGGYALMQDHLPALWRFGGGILIGLCGIDMVHAACRSRPSWLSRLGPLP